MGLAVLILNYSGLLYTISRDWLLYNVTLHKRVRSVKSSSAMTFVTIAGLRLVCMSPSTQCTPMLIVCTHACDVKLTVSSVCVCSRDCDFTAFWSVWWPTVVSLTYLEIIIRRNKIAESCSSISVCLLSEFCQRLRSRHTLCWQRLKLYCCKHFIALQTPFVVCFFYSLKSDHIHIFWRFQKCPESLNLPFH